MTTRLKATEIVFKVIFEGQYSNVLLNKIQREKAMSDIDIAFLFKIVYGTIQYKIYLEYVVNKIIDSSKTPRKIQVCLWMALYEFHFLEKQEYAVVNEYVEASKKIEKNHFGFVNKILRELTTKKELLEVNIKNNQNKLPLSYGFPFWLFKKIENEYSKDDAILVAKSSVLQPKICFRVNTLKISVDDFEKMYSEKIAYTKSKVAKNAFLTNEPIMNYEIFKDGLITIQDATSILATEILDPLPNTKVLDMCCAPGGKLTNIAAHMKNTGQLFAYEVSENKKRLIEENIERLGVTNHTIKYDDALKAEEKDFDSILLDAPCSGLGVLKRKPEIKLLKSEKIFYDNIVMLQSKLLDRAYQNLKVGGALVYSTCTINSSENKDQILDFINRHSDMNKVYEEQFFGHEDFNDGFYICKLIKGI